MSDSESDRKAAEEYKRLTREGLTAYFAQADSDNDGRVDWNIEGLVTLFLNVEQESYDAGISHERKRASEGEADGYVIFDTANECFIGEFYKTLEGAKDGWGDYDHIEIQPVKLLKMNEVKND